MITLRDDKNWSTYINRFDRKKDRMEFSNKEKRIMFGEILRKIVGWGSVKNKRWGYWCSPEYISKKTGIPYSTVRRFYDELVQRKVITFETRRWLEHNDDGSIKKDQPNTWIDINKYLDEWIEPAPTRTRKAGSLHQITGSEVN